MYELLLVDNEETSRNSLTTYFPQEDYGFHIYDQVSNRKEALDSMDGHIVHVVLTDTSIPTTGGIRLAERLRAREEEPPCIVFLNAYNNPQYVQDTIRYGVRFYILKPPDFGEIKETFSKIREELDKRYHIEEPLVPMDDEDEIICRVLEYIRTDCWLGTLGELLKRSHLNVSYLSQPTKLKVGKNFVGLPFEMRMKQAYILLQGPEVKIYQTSSLVGYTNPNSPIRAFRAHYSRSSKEYRLSHGGGGSR